MSKIYAKTRKIFLGAVLLFMAILPVFLYAQTIFFDPQNINVNLNTQFALPLKITDVNNLFGVGFDLNFDPNLVEYVNTQEGNFLNQGCSTVLLTNSDTPGKLIFGLTRLGASCSGVSGSGLIATINFSSKSQNGAGAMTFSNNSLCILSGSSCNNITGTWSPATVTIGSSDATPPIRSNGAPTGTLPFGTTQALMTLSTNENATCRYSIIANTVFSSMTNIFSITGGTTHSTTLTGLTNGSSYTRYIKCQDSAGNANLDDYVISFSVASDNIPPAISSINVSSISANSAAINWSTDEPADSQVEYGLSVNYGNQTSLSLSLETSHRIIINGLNVDTLYHFRVRSKDANGNLAISQDSTFTTLSDMDLCNPGQPRQR